MIDKQKESKLIKRILIVISIFIFAAVITSYFIIVNMMQRKVDQFKINVISNIEEQYKINIAYDSISPSILSSLNIRYLRIEQNDPDGDYWQAEIENVVVKYNLLHTLFFKDEEFLKEIAILGGWAELNISSNSEKEGDSEFSFETIQDVFNSIGMTPSIVVKRSRLDIFTETIESTVSINKMELKHGPEEYRLSLNSFTSGALKSDDDIHKWQAHINSRGAVSYDLNYISISNNIESLETDWIEMENQSFQFTLDQDIIEVTKIKNKLPIDLSIQYDLITEDVSAYILADGAQPDDIFEPGPALIYLKPFMDISFSGLGEVKYNITSKDLFYGLDGTFQLNGQQVLNNNSQYIPQESTITAIFTGDKYGVEVENLLADTDILDLEYIGDFDFESKMADGFLNIDNFYLPSGLPLSLELELSHEENYYLADTKYLAIGDLHFSGFKNIAHWDDEYKTLSLTSKFNGAKEVELLVDFIWSVNEEPNAWLTLNHFPISDLYYLATGNRDDSTSDSLAPYYFDLNLTGSLKNNFPEISLDNFNLYSDIDENQKVSFNGYIDKYNASINDFFVEWGDMMLTADCVGDLRENGMDLSGRVSVQDMVYDIFATYDYGRRLMVSSNFGLDAEMKFLTFGAFTFDFSCEELPIPLKDVPTKLTLDLSGNFDNGSWYCFSSGSSIKIGENPYVNEAEISFTALLKENNIDIYQLNYIDNASTVSGSGKVNFSTTNRDENIINGWLNLKGDGDEEYRIVLNKNDGSESIVAKISNFPMSRLATQDFTGVSSANIQASRHNNGDFTIGGDLSTDFYNTKRKHYTLFSNFIADQDKLLLSNLDLTTQKSAVRDAMFMFDRSSSLLVGSGDLEGLTPKYQWKSDFSMNVSLNQQPESWTDFEGIETAGGKFFLNSIYHEEDEVFPFLALTVDYEDKVLNLNAQDSEVLSLFLDMNSGEVEAYSHKVFPVQFDAKGVIADSEINLAIRNIETKLEDWNSLYPYDWRLDKPHMTFSDGIARGNIVVSGPISDPGLYGFIDIDNIKIHSMYTYEDVKPFVASITLDDKVIKLHPLTIPFGDGGVVDADGVVYIDHGRMQEYQFNLLAKKVRGGRGVHGLYQIWGIDVDGSFTGLYIIAGDDSAMYMTGDLYLEEATFSLGEKKKAPPKTRLRFNRYGVNLDMKITTGRRVRFAIPNQDFPIVEANMDIGNEIQITYNNIYNTVYVLGDLDIRNGEVTYLDRVFYLKEGVMIFDEQATELFDPGLDITAEIDTSDYRGEPLSIFLNYKGSLFSDFTPEVSSYPNRSNEELVTILGQSLAPGNIAEDGVQSVLLSTSGNLISQYGLVQPVEETLKEVLNLDIVVIDTNIIENALFDLYSNSETNNNYSIASYLDGTSLSGGKYIGQNLYVSGSLILDYKDDMGLNSAWGAIEIDPAFAVNLETPLFDIGWNYLADDFQSGFISNSSVSIAIDFVDLYYRFGDKENE